MPRINFYEPLIFVTTKVTFSCSPVNKERFKLEHARRINRKDCLGVDMFSDVREELNKCKKDERDFYWALSHPISAIRLIKHHHLTSYTTIFLYFVHILLCLHFTIKSFVHTVYTGADLERIEYFNSIYYPHLAGITPEPALWSNVFLGLSTFALVLRLRCAYMVMKNALINEKHYKHIQITQCNLASLTVSSLSLSDWFRFWTYSSRHHKEIERDEKKRERHSKLDLENIQSKLDKLTSIDAIYYFNLFGYECYEVFDEVGFFKEEDRPNRYKRWHCPQPYARVGLNIARLGLVVMAVALMVATLVWSATFFGLIYLELRSSLPKNQASFKEVFSNGNKHFSSLITLRLVESLILESLMLPNQVSYFSLNVDSCYD